MSDQPECPLKTGWQGNLVMFPIDTDQATGQPDPENTSTPPSLEDLEGKTAEEICGIFQEKGTPLTILNAAYHAYKDDFIVLENGEPKQKLVDYLRKNTP